MFPSLHDMFIAGMVTAGESYRDCAIRELEEEVAISGIEPDFVLKHLYRDRDNPNWTALFRVVWDGPIAPQREEIEWGAWMSVDDLNKRINEWEFAPDGLEVYERYQRWLRSSQSSG